MTEPVKLYPIKRKTRGIYEKYEDMSMEIEETRQKFSW